MNKSVLHLRSLFATALGLLLIGGMMMACDDLDSTEPEDAPTATPVPETPTPVPTATPTPTPDDGISVNEVQWLDTDVSGWAETSNLSIRWEGSQICLDYDKVNEWPTEVVYGTEVNANVWVIVQQNGTWYGGTWEWLRPGTTCKDSHDVDGNHIKQAPLDNWNPQSGEKLGFMVSGLARQGYRSVAERTNIEVITWP